jgi:hypothetical protein
MDDNSGCSGELEGRCSVTATIYRLPERTVVHRVTMTSCSLEGWIQKFIPPGRYQAEAKVEADGGMSRTGSANLVVRR